MTALDITNTSENEKKIAAVYNKITRRLIPFLILCYFFAYLDRVNVGFAKLHMQDALNFSDTVYGVGAPHLALYILAAFLLLCAPLMFLLPAKLVNPRRNAGRS